MVDVKGEDRTTKKLIIVASTVVALGIGTAAGLALSTTANPKRTWRHAKATAAAFGCPAPSLKR